MKRPEILTAYLKIIALNAVIQLVIRVLETALIIFNHGIQKALIGSELLGVVYDLVITSTILIIIFPLFILFCRISIRTAVSVFLFLIATLTVLHVLILTYFLYQLIPLSTFIYQYGFKEIWFTIGTSGTSYLMPILAISVLTAVIILFYKVFQRRVFSKNLVVATFVICVVFFTLAVIFKLFPAHLNKFSENKSIYFYSRSCLFLIKDKSGTDNFSRQTALDYQKLFPDRLFLSTEYPLLHTFEKVNVLDTFFNRFDSAPNIVILVVEGLNDDFIHPYKGIDLMPFLSDLVKRSLYWSRCFSPGERSFAVMPSILGSLPYGETGFTLLNKLPRHFSLVSLLHANDYYTSFFYGQGSWFHRKDRFFRYNDIDLIMDNGRFSDKYKKIIIGRDKFFWGYHDKDLFNQSFEILDTIPRERRLDIYFTGTSHSPFAIADCEQYDIHYAEILRKLENEADKEFFTTHKPYIQSILFVNDALEDFFRKYETRSDFSNTLFIITGDHPMTEMPVANSLRKYHVPLIMYSPKLRKAAKFTQIVSHLDIYETLLAFLSDYNLKVPGVSTALGGKLIGENPVDSKRIAFMNDDREINEYYSDHYFLSGQRLFRVAEDLSLTISADKDVLERLENERETFKKISLYVSVRDKIIPDSIFFRDLGYNIIDLKPGDDKTVHFSTEYYDLVPEISVQNKAFFFDISFDHKGKADEGFSLVYQVSGKNDSAIYWRNTGVTYDGNSFQAHIEIPGQNIPDSVLYFKSFFWNRNKRSFYFEHLKYSVYKE
jgi:phosphoglycerol transferase MdoB-like AlkP superfamily enzyme